MMNLGYILAGITVLCLCCGNLCFDATAKRHPSLFNLHNILRLALQPVFIVGLVFYGLGTVLWVAALQHVPVSYLYPFLASQYLLVPMISLALKREWPSLRLASGFLLLFIGLGFIVSAG